ncbi:MAG: PEP-CTERM sorting domain-containing protein [Rhodocyclaceae bacterium]|nr:PEP-CTERM sorting domain-containing protein [Rhodocyclaceae bacterium]
MNTLRATIALLAFAAGSACAATNVAPTNPAFGLYDLGSFAAGTYDITATGIVDLTGDGRFRMRPDGVPETAVTAPGYAYFNPSGSYLADGGYGPGGINVKIGALMGTLTAAPAGPGDWFQIGYGTTLTLGAAGHIYAAVNDTYYPNDTGAFRVEVTPVPEPGEYAMLLAGLGVIGAIRRRRPTAKAV